MVLPSHPLNLQRRAFPTGPRGFVRPRISIFDDHFRAAFTHPDFLNALGAYPSSTVAQPHLFTKIAVSNLCTA
jgi:hypothetical protein